MTNADVGELVEQASRLIAHSEASRFTTSA